MRLNKDKGVAGLSVFLTVIVFLFIIGLVVMIFTIMSSEIQDANILYERSSDIAVKGELIRPIDTGNTTTAMYLTYYGGYRSATCSIVEIYNGTGGVKISSGNWTEISECVLANTTSTFARTTAWAVNYTYDYLVDAYGTAGTINDTSTAVGNSTDWFDIFIVIGAMVVLILLVVIIISSIRGTGLILGNSGKPTTLGSA